MSTATTMIGLMCHPAIRWLIVNDKGVNDYIQSFIRGDAPKSTFDVAGPPSPEDAKRLWADPVANVLLPTITLHLKMDTNVNGPFVRVTASDGDVTMLQAWMLRATSGPIQFEPERPSWH